jgi:hypothetical protein
MGRSGDLIASIGGWCLSTIAWGTEAGLDSDAQPSELYERSNPFWCSRSAYTRTSIVMSLSIRCEFARAISRAFSAAASLVSRFSS